MCSPSKRIGWLFIRTIGIARATTKIGMANLVYNIKRLIFLRKIANRLTGLCYSTHGNSFELIAQLRSS